MAERKKTGGSRKKAKRSAGSRKGARASQSRGSKGGGRTTTATGKRCFPGISPRAYEHPADRAALVALRSVPGFDQVVRKLFGLVGDRALRLAHPIALILTSENAMNSENASVVLMSGLGLAATSAGLLKAGDVRSVPVYLIPISAI